MASQNTHLYHNYSSHWTALPFPAMAQLLLENDALPMRRLAALKTCILNGNEYSV